MPKIDKIKKTKSKKKALVKSPAPKTSKRTKKNPVAYYGCLYQQAQTGFPGKITACCKDCKQNAPALNKNRQQEIQKLINSYKQVGESLSKLLVH